MNETLEYYNDNAKTFVEGTVNVDFTHVQQWFLRFVPAGSTILDFGCGSGRDSRAFLDLAIVSML